MITRRPLVGALVGGAGWALPGFAGAQANAFEGTWGGVLSAGSQQLRLRLDIGPNTTTLFSMDQGGAPISATERWIQGERIRLGFPSINGAYEGRLEGDRIVGTWRQGGDLPLVFERGERFLAQTPEAPLTDEGLEQLRARTGAPALAVAALNTGTNASLAFARGLRAHGRTERVGAGDKWHVGSITKSMTATLVAQCVESGAVNWDDTVGDMLGNVVGDIRPEYRDATFRHLLSHRAGLQANLNVLDVVRYARQSADARADRIAYARSALRQTPVGPKEQTFTYSNNGYVIAGAMLEARLGAPWEQLITERLFAPLSMSSAGFGAPGTPGAYDQPSGHAPNLLGRPQPHPPGAGVTDNPAVLGPAGRAHASLEDMLRYLRCHCERRGLLERAESWSILHTPPFGGDYAMGWIRRPDGSLWHNGSNTLWYAEVAVDQQRRVVSVAACNYGRDSMARPVGEALTRAAATVA
ncbi:MAG: beta-lactamase family protein [Hyphomonadaceae bacterium]|nr:beta-lactamase family protein [Hyphomonadaceae bacterium]